MKLWDECMKLAQKDCDLAVYLLCRNLAKKAFSIFALITKIKANTRIIIIRLVVNLLI